MYHSLQTVILEIVASLSMLARLTTTTAEQQAISTPFWVYYPT